MSTRDDLTIEQKINLIRPNESDSSYREGLKYSLALYRILSKEKENI